MKYINIHIILMLMFVAALTGCEQKILFDDDKNEHIYQLPENGYIFFNSAISNNTRGSLITTPYLQQDFGVIGYQWDYTDANANWETQEQIKPNLFANTHQQVTYANNIHSYTPIKKWETGKRYAFFAYYPYSNSAIVVSGADVEHTPYLTYTLPTDPDPTDPTDPAYMIDIMTASAIDMDYSSSQGGIVNLAFKHRLSAIDVQMLNLNDPYLTGEDRLPVYIKVTNMVIEFDNLRYNTAKLYIDNTIPGHSDEFTTNGPVEQNYILFTELTEQIPPVETGANVTYVTSGNPLIVIPQKEFLNGTLSFNYQYLIKNADGTFSNKTSELKTNDEGGYKGEGENGYIERKIEFNISRDLLPGRRYTLLLTFTRNATTIDILKDGDWEDHRSEITFE